jgi:nitrous oxidase accessory protein NosD
MLIGIGMGKSAVLLLVFVLLTASCIIMPLPVKAGSKTIVVPDDYLTIAAAINNATSGDTILVRTGVYKEHSLSINKPLMLIGENAENTVIKNIDPPTPLLTSSIMVGATAIIINADNITISGFKITSGGRDIGGGGNGTQIVGNILEDGIQIQRGNYQNISNNIINGWTDLMSPYNYFVNNTGNCHLVIQTMGNQGYNNVVFNNSFAGVGAGVDLYGTHDNLVVKNNFVNCNSAIHSDMSYNNLIVANTISNGDIGLAVVQGSQGELFYANSVVNNTCAVVVSGNNTFYQNNFINNENQVESADLIVGPNPPASIVWDDGREGNFWSHYDGVDVNLDGIGDTPYVINADNTDCYPLMAPFDISSATVELPEWASNLPFEIQELNPPEPFPIVPVAAVSVAMIAVVTAFLLVHFKKRKHKALV